MDIVHMNRGMCVVERIKLPEPYFTQHLDYCSLLILRFVYLWSSGQSFWLQTQRSRVRSPALPDFLSSRGSGTGFTQPREVN